MCSKVATQLRSSSSSGGLIYMEESKFIEALSFQPVACFGAPIVQFLNQISLVLIPSITFQGTLVLTTMSTVSCSWVLLERL